MGMKLMKKYNKHSLQLGMVLVAMILPIQHLSAQVAPESPAESSDTTSWAQKTIDLFEAHDKPLGEALDEIRDLFDGVQIVTSGPVDKLKVDIELRSANVNNILRAIELNLLRQVSVEWEDDNMVAVHAKLPREEIPILEAYSLASYMSQTRSKLEKELPEGLSDKDSEEVLKSMTFERVAKEIHEITIESLAELSSARGITGKLEMPRLSFHPRSELLIVVGQTETVVVVGQIIRELNTPIPPSRFGGNQGPGMVSPDPFR